MAAPINLIGVPDKTKHNQNFDMHIGEDKVVFIALQNIDGTDFDVSGMTFEWWMAKTAHSAKLLQKEIGSGVDVVSGTGGGVNVTLASAETYDLVPEIYYHELKVYKPDETGTVSVACTGAAILRHALDMRDVVNPLGVADVAKGV